jgi:hypothetical protein
MNKAGFRGIPNEWWHFDAFPLDWVRKNLRIYTINSCCLLLRTYFNFKNSKSKKLNC